MKSQGEGDQRMTVPDLLPPSTAMLRMLAGAWISQALYVVARLGIADLVRDQAKTASELAEATQTKVGALYRVLRALAETGVFEEQADAHFALTPLGECLRSDVAGSLRAFAIMLGEKEHRHAWDHILYSVRTGEPAFDHVFGVPHFQYFASKPDAARVFDEGMTSRSGIENDAIVAAYDFSKFSMIVDVGGGQGTLLACISRSVPQAKSLLFDLPHVIAESSAAAPSPEAIGYQLCAGSFFDRVPSGGDLYVLKKIIHDWDDARASLILENCHAAMSSKARLLVIEPVVPPGNAPSFNKLLDLMMLVWTSGGKERTEAEHRAILGKAGFEILRVQQTGCPLVIVEAAVSEPQ
jgi:hypothetical protein